MYLEVSSAQLQCSREEQQDYLITRYRDEGNLIAILADRLGGGPHGGWAAEAASSAAAAVLYEGALDGKLHALLEQAHGAAHRAVQSLVPAAHAWNPPSTTLIHGLFLPDARRVAIASVGDSYLFRRRSERFEILNRDFQTLHSPVGWPPLPIRGCRLPRHHYRPGAGRNRSGGRFFPQRTAHRSGRRRPSLRSGWQAGASRAGDCDDADKFKVLAGEKRSTDAIGFELHKKLRGRKL